MIPDPTPVVGTALGERLFTDRPSAVIVTTDWRAFATIPVRSSVPTRLPATAAFAVAAGVVDVAGVVPRKPPMRAGVSTDAGAADRGAAATTVLMPRPRPRLGGGEAPSAAAAVGV